MRTLIIVPAFNEEEALPAVLQELTTVPEVDVLVIDDGSSDGTARVASAAGVRTAMLPYNLGIGGALRTGFRYAERHDYDAVIQFDADGQHRADQIKLLLDGLNEGADVVIGTRFADGAESYQVSRLRGSAMRALKVLVLLLSGQHMSDTSSGFRCFNRRAVRLFSASYPAEYMDSVEALIMALQAGLKVREVPVLMRERMGGVASNRSWRLVYHYIRVVLVVALSARSGVAGRANPSATPRGQVES